MSLISQTSVPAIHLIGAESREWRDRTPAEVRGESGALLRGVGESPEGMSSQQLQEAEHLSSQGGSSYTAEEIYCMVV